MGKNNGRRFNGVVYERAHLTGDTKAYEENYDRIFGRKGSKRTSEGTSSEGKSDLGAEFTGQSGDVPEAKPDGSETPTSKEDKESDGKES